ncbi:bifunctional diaminohydroxyphosphoribosylaminopyrimidine deaminase/5-amino-6-(5-phosphoribosylamino)uracil reductase RibD [Azohydromonas sediminis]|uniref:bifunctional diaminohydroxyphosphoribosylaminopyrimidine deaminase/5-amino-6-(5-phosphoribosylamino)uracil reductase RibD n=1 Tax=Azohydromonas sediminis TaxID=2259674 RepID=UPI000E655CC5|nr:bifunctional diaminohydroxyphosphoribosylaminopyrimidine deaminase/5-amino-6-(5-phosphoribosylamino)uracil reductase RibD [Azohydromonas sediminis]
MLSDIDRHHLQRALALAHQSIGLSDPNPRVGCVIAGDGWQAEGFTQAAGQAHAEVMALRAARAAGRDLRGSTVYVTLEPCAHFGRTPPCCDALVEAGVGRVVVAVGDPNPRVAGQGIARLRAAGIAVEMADDEIANASRELNIGFFSRMTRGRPWVRVKVAMSLDGRTALLNGASQWITGEAARADGHAWRRRAGAVLTGIGTVLADDPRLDVRLVPTTLQPLRVVVDSRLRLPTTARLLAPPGAVLVAAATSSPHQEAVLRAGGAEVVTLPNAQGGVDLPALLALLGERGVNEVHVEAGARLNGALLDADLVDEWLVYLAPCVLGPGREFAQLPAREDLAQCTRLQYVDIQPCGSDLRVRARPQAGALGPR